MVTDGESAYGDGAVNDHDASVVSGSHRFLPGGESPATTERISGFVWPVATPATGRRQTCSPPLP